MKYFIQGRGVAGTISIALEEIPRLQAKGLITGPCPKCSPRKPEEYGEVIYHMGKEGSTVDLSREIWDALSRGTLKEG